MKSLLRSPALTLTASLAILCQIPLAYAEDKNIEVKAGDTLSTIIAEHYPNYKNNKAIMQALMEANPASFKNQSVHQLIVGKTLRLPDAASIPNLQPAELKTETATITNSAQTEQELIQLKNQLKTLEADKTQLATQVKELSAAGTDTPDPAILIQQLDEIESANEQILAEKNKLTKEQEDLKKQLQTLEADKKQLETKLAEQASPAAPNEAASTTESVPADAIDPAILMQQLDEIESANEQILADKKQLEQERDQLKQQVQTLQAGNKQAEATATASTTTPDAATNVDAPDPAILMQQLDEIEAANEQLLTDKNKLQSDLDTAQQQLKEREQTMSALSGQITENKQQLETTQQELLLANAARASAELNKASLEKQRGSWLPWLLALLMLPVGWFLGRRSKVPEPTPDTHKAVETRAIATAAVATATATAQPLEQDTASTLPNVAELAQTDPSIANQTIAANDDNVDAAIKLDIVRAYLDLRDPTAASSLLKEVLHEGGRQQQQEAREILSFLG
ncbi:MAG: FimV/HubP family polar landmark protein [Thiolinea sp.]